ncbi:cystine ABC transporter substrate-binding protein [Segnochrobactrum spirostomi]|uniref:Cystine ABC transporter substrate-binding protein n=1 Tax=Segnochrobactrum spirostomi TaxID=2608987 RepID=A0A6A7Y5W2_9HYPH|nr:cystine ABC transporter substrate-binding protein [Segnochrobactrum spirostomi]MQT14640.1 cystine ABC transporter substrate-binding protein [Segnochrobactrum spirostomi]
MPFPSAARRWRGRAIAFLAALVVAGAGVPARAGSVYDHIEATHQLVVGMEGTYPPFNFQDSSGKLVGFEVDFANALAAELKVKPVFQLSNWSGLLGALQSGRVDVVINQVADTPEREKIFDFSEPYSYSGIQIVVKKGNPDNITGPETLAGKTVAAGLGTNYGQWLVKNVPTAIPRTYDDNVTPYQDLAAGRIDAVLNDRLVVADIVKRTGNVFEIVGKPFDPQGSSIALPKDAELQAALNHAIDALRANGTLKTISEKWFGIDVTARP